MTWWHNDTLRVHLEGVLAHCNEAIDSNAWVSDTHVCDLYFRALNKYWNAFNHHVGELTRGDVTSFAATLQAMPGTLKATLLDDVSVRSLIAVSPPVMNHHTLTKRGYVLGQEISDSIKHEATAEHRKAQKALIDRDTQLSEESLDRLLKRLADFLYVIRSNIAHGEKTPYGPDLEKAHRDRQVSEITLPAQRLILDLLLDQPSQKLVAYGTIQPGGCNSQVLRDCGGSWEPCTAHGDVFEINGLPGFRYRPSGPPVIAMLLTTPHLNRFWKRLDGFEGEEYVRHLIPVRTGHECVVAHVYEQRSTVI